MKKFVLVLLLLTSSQAMAAPGGAVNVGPSVYSASNNGKTFNCASINNNSVAGIVWRKDPSFFIPYTAKIKQFKKAKRKASSSKAQKLSKKIKKFKKLNKLGKKACSLGGGGTGDCNFTGSGEVTAKGKAVFGIPSYLSANLMRGQEVYQFNCVGCHEERIDWTFPNLRANISRPPMYFDYTTMPDENLAHLTAYFNRYRICD